MKGDEKIIFKIFGCEYDEGHVYTDENEKIYMIVQATEN